MGAGSTVFAKNVIGDSLMCDALRDDLIEAHKGWLPEYH